MLPLFGNGSFTLDDVLIAVRNAKLSTVAEYLVKGADPDLTDAEGNSLLMLAVREKTRR